MKIGYSNNKKLSHKICVLPGIIPKTQGRSFDYFILI